jgi:hypothetical protein
MTEEQIAKLAREVEVECLAVPGTSFYSVAEMAIEETLALLADGGKGEAVYQVLEPCEATWSDVDWLTYESTDGAFKRVLYTAPQAECAPREAQPVADTVRECLSDVVSHYRALYAGLAFQLNEATNTENSDDMAYWKHEIKALERMYVQAESALAAPTPERAPREAQPVVLVNRGALQAALNMLRRDAQEGRHARGELADEISASIAVPTPERAQPVGPRTTLNYDGTFDTTCAHCGGNGCFACLKSAAPTPERADAGKDAALTDDGIKEIWSEYVFDYGRVDFLGFARAILAANKEPK